MATAKQIKLSLNQNRENFDLYQYVNGKEPLNFIRSQMKRLKEKYDEDIDIYASRGYYRSVSFGNQPSEFFVGKKNDIYESIKNPARSIGLHEAIDKHEATKMYIDYDNTEDNLDIVITCLKKDFGTDIQLNITDGSRQKEKGLFKYSYHIIAQNRHFENHKERIMFKDYLKNTHVVIDCKGNTKTLEEIGCDTAVYNPFNLFRCINNSKRGRVQELGKDIIITTPPLKIMSVSYSMNPIDHLVKVVSSGSIGIKDMISKLEKKINAVISEKKFSMTVVEYFNAAVERHGLRGEINGTREYEKTEKLLNNVCSPFMCVRDDVRFTRWYRELSKKMRIYYIVNGLSFEEYWELRKLKTEYLVSKSVADEVQRAQVLKTELRINREKHKNLWEIDKQKNYSLLEQDQNEAGIIYVVKEFVQDYDKDVIKKVYQKNLTIEPTKDIQRIELISSDIDLSKRTTFLGTDMGSAKSKSVYAMVKDLYKLGKIESFLFLTSRTNLTSNIMVLDNPKNGGLGIFFNYQDTKDKTVLNSKKYLSICINSVHKLTNNYEFICIDECEIIFSNFCINDTKKTDNNDMNNLDSSTRFFDLVRNCKKLICCDALLMNTTISWINNIRKESYEVVKSSIRREPTKVKVLKYTGKSDVLVAKHEILIEKVINQIVERINNGKRIFIYWSYITPTIRNKNISRITQENLVSTMIARGAKITENDCIRHNSKENKKVLKDINEVWANKQVVIVNSSIAVGSSYENKENPFDYVYVFHSTTTAIPRDIAQVIKRCRQLSTDGMTYLIPFNGYNPDACLKKWIMSNRLIEKQAREIFFQTLAGRNIENLFFTLEQSNYTLEHIEITDRETTLSNIDTIREISKEDKKMERVVDKNMDKYKFRNIEVMSVEYEEENEKENNLEIGLKFDKLKFIRYFTQDIENGNKCLGSIGMLYDIPELKNLTTFLNKKENIGDYNKIENLDLWGGEGVKNIDINNFNNNDMKIFIKTLQNTELNLIKKKVYALVLNNTEFLTNEDKTYITKKLIRYRKQNTSKKLAETYLNVLLGFGFIVSSKYGSDMLKYINLSLSRYYELTTEVKEELCDMIESNVVCMFVDE